MSYGSLLTIDGPGGVVAIEIAAAQTKLFAPDEAAVTYLGFTYPDGDVVTNVELKERIVVEGSL